MDGFKKNLDERNEQWELFEDFRLELDEKSEPDIVKQCIEVLDNAMTFLLTSKLVSSEWTGILGKNGLLDTLEKKIRMAMGLGLLSSTDVRLIQQIEAVHRAFEAGSGAFQDEPVSSITNQFKLPENVFLPRNFEGNWNESTTSIKWNPLQSAQSPRGQFMYVFEYLYFDLLNRTAYFQGEPLQVVEDVTLPMVLDKQGDRYSAIINDLNEREAELNLEWKIAKQLKGFFDELNEPTLPPIEWNALKEKREANRKEEVRINLEMDELNKVREETKESWESYRATFSNILGEVEKTRDVNNVV